jgi:hypothetical protein
LWNHIEAGVHGALRVLLMGVGISEQRQNLVRRDTGNRSARLSDCRYRSVLEGPDHTAQFFGIGFEGELGRSDRFAS